MRRVGKKGTFKKSRLVNRRQLKNCENSSKRIESKRIAHGCFEIIENQIIKCYFFIRDTNKDTEFDQTMTKMSFWNSAFTCFEYSRQEVDLF